MACRVASELRGRRPADGADFCVTFMSTTIDFSQSKVYNGRHLLARRPFAQEIKMDLKLQGKTALITGSTAGIGAGIAAALAREGVTVVINGRNEARAKTVVEAITEAGGTAHIDILVSNVGGSPQGRTSFFEASVAEWAEIFNSNVLAGIRMIHHLVPAMRDRGWGRVIHIGSRNAISPHNNMPPYGASKAGVNNLSLGLSKELAFTGVTSNVIMPGLIHTLQLDEFLASIANRQFEGSIDQAKDFVLKNICRQTVSRLGRVEDIARYVCFLASPEAEFITGTVLRIDGGSTPTV